MSVCTGIKRLEKIDEATDMMLVTIDDEVNAYMIYSYTESLKFLNKEVIVSYRKDIYQGNIKTFINTLTIPTQVTTLTRDTNVKLFCEIEDNNSNVCFNDVQVGETFIGAIMYCVDCKYESSNKAVWMSVRVRDKAGKVTTVRLFDYSIDGLLYNGIYIKADIKRTKYGFTTDLITPMELDFPLNPEIEISKKYITNHFANDSYMLGLFERTHLLDCMQNYITLEKGYELVRLATQLDILHEMRNVLGNVSYQALDYAMVFRHGYIPKIQLSEYSPEMRTVVFALQASIPNEVAALVLRLLDPSAAENPPLEKDVYEKVVTLANSIIKAKKEVR